MRFRPSNGDSSRSRFRGGERLFLQSWTKSPFSIPVIRAGARRTPAASDTKQEAQKRRFGRALFRGGVRLRLAEREFFIDNLLVRVHFITEMIRWTGLAPCEFEFPFPGSFASTFLVQLVNVALSALGVLVSSFLVSSPH